MRKYRYNKKAGALQDALMGDEPPINQLQELSAPPPAAMRQANNVFGAVTQSVTEQVKMASMPAPQLARGGGGLPAPRRAGGLDYPTNPGWYSMFFYTVREGEQVLVTRRSGHCDVVVGPARVFRWWRRIEPLAHYVAHPGDFLVVRFRDGRQEHLAGPAHLWLDPRTHASVEVEEAVQIAAKEAVVVYAESDDGVSRRVVHGPETFVPAPGEWLHEFSWHGNAPVGNGIQKVPGALQFQKLWMMPDQMYHDVVDVRTSDDAVLTIRLMIFFELVDIETMLATTHDPIGDFVNAATSDVVEFVGQHAFDGFKASTNALNKLETYGQLSARASQCGYRINKVVYRGYGAPPALQRLHDEATQSRMRLQLERATETQQQELEDFKLDRGLQRAEKERVRQADEQVHQIEMARARLTEELQESAARQDARRSAQAADADERIRVQRERDAVRRAHLAELASMGVDLTAMLTSGAADKVIEVRGSEGTHIHVQD